MSHQFLSREVFIRACSVALTCCIGIALRQEQHTLRGKNANRNSVLPPSCLLLCLVFALPPLGFRSLSLPPSPSSHSSLPATPPPIASILTDLRSSKVWNLESLRNFESFKVGNFEAIQNKMFRKSIFTFLCFRIPERPENKQNFEGSNKHSNLDK